MRAAQFAAAAAALADAAAPAPRFPADYLLKGFTGAPWDFGMGPTELRTDGVFPDWLVGTLYRNGPGQWDPKTPAGEVSWFVGVAMFHSFHFGRDGKVTYRCRFPHTTTYEKDRNASLGLGAGAEGPAATGYSPMGDNTAVMIGRIDGELVATTGSENYNSFDPVTLELKELPFPVDESKMPWGVRALQMSPSHIHNMPDGSVVGYAESMLPPAGYVPWQIAAGSRKREPIAALRSLAAMPFYNHMMAATPNYVAVLEQPCAYGMNISDMSTADMFKYFKWQPEKGTRLRLVDRRTGAEKVYPLSRNTWMLHTVNAYETDRGTVVVDVADHAPACGCNKYLKAEYMSVIINGTLEEEGDLTFAESVGGLVVRIEAPLDTPGTTLTPAPLAPPECMVEVPTISYDKHNGQPYRYLYGAGIWDVNRSTMFDVLTKIDTEKGTCVRWHRDMHFPGEAVFVPRPGATEEDDGVLLSVVIDASTPDHGKDYLIAFNASTMEEVGRAWLPTGSHYMFQYHGIFTFDP